MSQEVVWEEEQWSLFRTLCLNVTCHSPPLWLQLILFQHSAEVDTSDVQCSPSSFLYLSPSLICHMNSQRINLPLSLSVSVSHSLSSDHTWNISVLCKWQTRDTGSKRDCGLLFSLSVFLERAPPKKIQQEHMFVEAFYIPNWKRMALQDYNFHLDYLFMLTAYSLGEVCCFRLSQQAWTTKPMLVHIPSLQTWPFSHPIVKPGSLPTLWSQVPTRLSEFLKWMLVLPPCLRHRSVFNLLGYRSVLPRINFMTHGFMTLNLSLLTCKIGVMGALTYGLSGNQIYVRSWAQHLALNALWILALLSFLVGTIE